MTRRNTVVAVLVVVALVGAMVLASVVGAGRDGEKKAPPFTEPTPVNGSAPSGLESFYNQKLTWKDCGQAKCTKVTVPVEYEKPEGDTLQLAVKVIPSEGGGGRSLFVNPGGPGGPALELTDYMSKVLGPEVLKRYDIVGVDPRGVGQSTPVDCVSDRELDHFLASDPSPDDATEVAEFRADYAKFGTGCKESGPLAAHVSTEEAARDFDVLRALFGSRTLDWFGFSYGTQLGATYATLFPKNVGRMVLDGAVDSSLSTIGQSLGQSKGFDRALRAYARDCVTRETCPLSGDADAALNTLGNLLKSVDAKPLKTDDHRRLTEGLANIGLATPLYSQKYWPLLTQAVGAALKGDGTPLLRLSDLQVERLPDGSFNSNLAEAFYAVGCLDNADRVTPAEARSAIPRFEKASPVFGRSDAWDMLGCADWPIKVTHPQIKIDATGSAPIVVIGTTRDPATPYEWSKALSDQLRTGVLVTREGDGHTAFASGNRCIDTLVNAYLAEGTVPKDGTTCGE